MEYLKELRTEHCSWKLRSDGIIESMIDVDYDGKIEYEEGVAMEQAMKELCKDGAYPLLAHMHDNNIVDAARVHLLENIHVSMCAMLGTTFFARMMANLFINFKKLPIPMKLFNDKQKALDWVELQQLKLNKKKSRA